MNKELVEVSICCHQQHTVVGQSRINYGIASRRLSLLMNYLFSMSRPQRYSPAAVLLGFGKRIEKASLSNSSKSVRQRFLSYKLGDGKKTCSSFCLSKENQTIPNYITFGRIFASPCLTYAVMNDMKVWALGGCLVFAFSDWLDGYIAKNYDQKSTLGAYLDPLADKVMIGSLSIGLMHHNLIPVELVGLIVGRDVFLLTMSFIIRGLDKAPDAPFFETTKTSTFEVIPSDISKVLYLLVPLVCSLWLNRISAGEYGYSIYFAFIDIEQLCFWIAGDRLYRTIVVDYSNDNYHVWTWLFRWVCN